MSEAALLFVMGPVNAMEAEFQSISDRLGFPTDQVRYIILLSLSYPVALFFRHALHPNHTSVLVRHTFTSAIGIIMGFLCFGWQMLYLFGMVGVSYALLWLVPPNVVQRYSMVWAMGCISAAHTYRLITDFGGYHLDFTGPLMVFVQKVTMVAFALHDGLVRPESKLNADQKHQKLTRRPTPLEYAGYMFNFHSILSGPSCTIRDHLDFMDGSNVKCNLPPNQQAQQQQQEEPSYWYPVVSKLFYSLIALGLYIWLGSFLSYDQVFDTSYSFLYRVLHLHAIGLFIRSKYYFFWTMAESIHNAAGLGFSGNDEQGNPKWDVMTNIHVLDVELATNPRAYANAWNTTTSKWLRRVCYERVTFHPALLSFGLSAWWHGFYPGYYLSFIYFGLVNEAGKKMRRVLRDHFQTSLVLKRTYDVITWLSTCFFIDFGSPPFVLLWFWDGLHFWSFFYYIPAVMVSAVMLLLPAGKRSSNSAKKVESHLASDASDKINYTPPRNHFIHPIGNRLKTD